MKAIPPSEVPYQKITHQQRICAIYLRIVHSLGLDEIMARTGLKYNTIRNLLRTFRKCGRTNKQGQISKRKKKICKIIITSSSASPSSQLGTQADSRPIEPGSENLQVTFTSAIGARKVNGCKSGIRSRHGGRDQACSLRLYFDTGSYVNEAGQLIKDQYSVLPKAAIQEREALDEAATEMVSTHIDEVQNLKESRASIFSGKLAHLNQCTEGGRKVICSASNLNARALYRPQVL